MKAMKKISICIPCYNEEKNIMYAYDRVKQVLQGLPEYDYEIIFADNSSQDGSRELLRKLAGRDKKVKVILNMRNFGPARSGKNACYHAQGDAVISMPCDLQEPPEMIPEFIKYWEEGHSIVWGQKTRSKENSIKYICRQLYYKIIQSCSDIPQYNQTTGFGVLDRSVLNVVKGMQEPDMSMRHLIAELGYPVKLIPYVQNKRNAGKSSFNLWRYFDFAVSSLIMTSRVPLRITTIMGAICAAVSFFMGIMYLLYKLLYWDAFTAGIAPIVIAVFFLGSVQLLAIGMIGEYLGAVLSKVTKRPLVMEAETINFEEVRQEERNE